VHLAQTPIPSNQSLFECCLRSSGATTAAQVPTQQFSCVAVNDQGQVRPLISARPDPTQVGGPAFIGLAGHGGQCLDTRSESHRALSHLPAHELEDALHRVFVHAQQMRHRAVTKRGVLFNHGFDGLHELFLNLGCGFGGLVVQNAPPAAL